MRVTLLAPPTASHLLSGAAVADGLQVLRWGVTQPEGAEVALPGVSGFGEILQAALGRATGEALVLLQPDTTRAEIDALLEPLRRDQADVALGRRPAPPLREAAVSRAARLVVDSPVTDLLSRQAAFRVTPLRETTLRSKGDDAWAELLVKLSAQLYRFTEVPLRSSGPRWPARELAALARTFLRYATVSDDADNAHEGYSTLAHLEAGAPNYNAWLGERFREHAGARVLEIGAGIGTITSHLAPGREKVVALEVDPFYVRRLQNRFRGQPNVEPYQSDVALADWEALAAQDFDTIVLSNVLEHIPDDAGAVRRFAQILPPGGRLLILVPALPALFGSLDEAVGHHRRYDRQALKAVLEGNGFAVESLEWMNLAGIPGWFVNGRILKRRVLPPLQLRLYDALAPYLARAEATVTMPVGMSLLCVARRA